MVKKVIALETLPHQRNKLSMESILLTRIQQHRKVALEGFLDMFFGKEKEKRPELKLGGVITFLENLKDKDLTLPLYYTKVEDYLAYLEELIRVGLPFMEKDIKRLLATFKFIDSKGKAIVEFNNIKELYKISGFDPVYHFTPKLGFDFKTFTISVRSYHSKTETSDDPKFFEQYTDDDLYNFMDEYNTDKEGAIKVAPLLTFSDGIPTLDILRPKFTTKEINKVIVPVTDHNHSKLINAAIALIKECNQVVMRNDIEAIEKLACKIDDAIVPDYGDGDEYGMYRLFIHSHMYLYELKQGFEEDVIATFKDS